MTAFGPVGYDNAIPAIAQLVEHLTVDYAEIRWSLARFRVAGLFCHSSLPPPLQTLSQCSFPAHTAFFCAGKPYRTFVQPPATSTDTVSRAACLPSTAVCTGRGGRIIGKSGAGILKNIHQKAMAKLKGLQLFFVFLFLKFEENELFPTINLRILQQT